MPENTDLAVNGTPVVAKAYSNIAPAETEKHTHKVNDVDNKYKADTVQAPFNTVLKNLTDIVTNKKEIFTFKINDATSQFVIDESLALTRPEIDELAKAFVSHVVRVARSKHPKPAGAPLPNKEDLAAAGNLYSQVLERNPSHNIIAHLRSPVWWQWIERDELTRPDLFHRDLSAYRALSKWVKKPGNDLQEALGGHDVPSKPKINVALAEAAEQLGAVMPSSAYWAKYRRDRARER